MWKIKQVNHLLCKKKKKGYQVQISLGHSRLNEVAHLSLLLDNSEPIICKSGYELRERCILYGVSPIYLLVGPSFTVCHL